MNEQDIWNWKVDEQAKPAEPGTVATGELAANPHVPGMTSIIIAVHNINYPLLHYTGHCIGSIKEHTDKEKTPYEIILVDNGSTVQLAGPEQYHVDKYARNETNKGCAHAWNQGIRISSGDYICLLNNDTLVFDHWLEDLQEALDQVSLVMATPMYGEPFSRAVEAAEKRAEWASRSVQESLSDFRDFACVFTSKDLFNTIGLFDEQFFAYGEDLDLYKRMDLAGLKYASTRKVNIFHVINATASNMPEIPRIMDESREKLKSKVYTPPSPAPLAEPVVAPVATLVSPPPVYTVDNLPPLIRTAETGDKIFLICGKRAHWVTSPEVLVALGYGLGDVVTVDKDILYRLDIGEQIIAENVTGFRKTQV